MQLWHPCCYWRGVPSVVGFSTVVEILWRKNIIRVNTYTKEDHQYLTSMEDFSQDEISTTYREERYRKEKEGACWELGGGGLELDPMRR
jgi:hypothetical protein